VPKHVGELTACEGYIQCLGEYFVCEILLGNPKRKERHANTRFLLWYVKDADRASGYMASKVGCEDTDELERFWKEVVVTYSRYYFFTSI
jgi:hypothetical protein